METIQINGKDYHVELILKDRGRTATARFRNGKIIIRIPKRAPAYERKELYESLLRRTVNSIAKGKWKEKKKLKLIDGEKIEILGKEYEVKVTEGKNKKMKFTEDTLMIRTPGGTAGMEKKIHKHFLHYVESRLRELNELHFKEEINSVSLRNTKTRWGSCSSNGRISLSSRLLLAPPEILDYVIIHELAHTKVKSHGKRFWSIVENIMPDHKERRQWLRKNDSNIPVI